MHIWVQEIDLAITPRWNGLEWLSSLLHMGAWKSFSMFSAPAPHHTCPVPRQEAEKQNTVCWQFRSSAAYLADVDENPRFQY